jgi:phospholipase C
VGEPTLVTDECGGFYDRAAAEVRRRARGRRDRLGFRVPALVIGPYVKTTSSMVRDHTSALKH